MNDACAISVAARVAEVLPARYGLLSFSTDEEDEHADQYDMVAGTPPSGQFQEIAPDLALEPVWIGAARLLLDSVDGSASAAGVVDALCDRASSLIDFVDALKRWVLVDAAVDSTDDLQNLDSATLAYAASDERFVERLIYGPAVERLASTVMAGDVNGLKIVRVGVTMGMTDRLVPYLSHAASAAPPSSASTALIGISGISLELACTVTRRAVERWNSEARLGDLTPDQAVTLVRIIAARGGPPGRAGDALLSTESFTTTMANAHLLPTAWRARAVKANPWAVDREILAQNLTDRGFAQDLLTGGDPRALEAVGTAISRTRDPLRLMRSVARYVPADLWDDWYWNIAGGLGAPDRYELIRDLVADRNPVEPEWVEEALRAFVDTVLLVRTGRHPLPEISAIVGLKERAPSLRLDEWKRFGRELSRAQGRAAVGAARLACDLSGPADVDAAIELAVDTLTNCSWNETGWHLAALEMQDAVREGSPTFAERLLRSALRGERMRPPAAIMRVVEWIAAEVDAGRLSARFLTSSIAAGLRPYLSSRDATRIRDSKKSYRSRQVRSWLADIVEGSGGAIHRGS